MKRALWLVLLAASTVLAQEPAPCVEDPNMVCVDSSLFEEILLHQQLYEALDNAIPELTLEPFSLVQDRDGRLFYPKELRGHLKVAHKNYDVLVPVDVVVNKAPAHHSLFGFRYKAAAYADLCALGTDTRFGGAVLVEPMRLGVFGLNSYLGTTSIGGVVSVDVTKNFSLFAGAGITFSDGALSVPAGASFSFN